MTRRVDRIAVVGRDAGAWLAAVSLQRALGGAGVKVQLVELPPRQRSVDAFAAVPTLRALHRLLGIDEAIIFEAARGVPVAAQRFSNWSGAAPPFLYGFDNPPPPGGDIDFTQYWLKGRLEGLKVPFEDFSLAASAAKQGRVPAASSGESPLSASFGYHLDARGYTEMLRQFARAIGVSVRRSATASPQMSGDTISAVVLDDGARIEADLFVDASGVEQALIGKMPGAEMDSWRELFPCDRLLSASGPRLRDLPSFSQVSAFRSGWVAMYPLQDRTAVVAGYDSRSIGDDELTETIGIVTRMPISGDAVVTPNRPGVQRRPWIGNCVAVGEAAATLDGLDAVQLHVAHSCITHLVNLFPASADRMPEAEAYNRVIATAVGNLRDFQLAHYRLNRRFDEPFWDAARDASVPETLQNKLRLFAARGLVPLYDEESVHEASWAALFLGHGHLPQDYDPRVDLVPDEEHIARVQQRLRDVAGQVRAMPGVEQFLGQLRQPAVAQ